MPTLYSLDDGNLTAQLRNGSREKSDYVYAQAKCNRLFIASIKKIKTFKYNVICSV